jgi:hypothetical protein
MRAIIPVTYVAVVIGLVSPLALPAQEISIARAAAKIDTLIPWITDGFHATDPGLPVANLPRGVDRAKLLDEALARAKAEKKPVLWYIPRIEGGHMVRPEFPDEYMRMNVFTDPEIAALINAGFVPLRMPVPRDLFERTGVKAPGAVLRDDPKSGSSWVEPAIAILDADGKILHRLDRIRTFHRDFFLTFLGRATSVTLPARERHPGVDEEIYSVAVEKVLRSDTSGAESAFRDVVARFGAGPWGARAAGNLMRGRDTTPVGPAFHAYEDTTPLPEGALAESRPSTAWPRPASELHSAVQLAVGWLLRHQCENGGFDDARYAYCDTPRILPNVWVAITAIALAGLNEWREVAPAAIDAATQRGEQYLFNPANLAPGRNEECYADSFRLMYLARRLAKLPADGGEAMRLRRRLRDIAGTLADQQGESGFWAHEYGNAFCSAAALVALEQAKQAGATVPPSVFEKGLQGVRSCRGSRGTFAYSGTRPGGGSDDALKNAMARMPVCEQALLIGAKDADTAALEAALDNFDKWLPRFERIRVCDFHTDVELGGFFFWHGMFLTSEAMQVAPPEKRAAHQKTMLDHVMSIGEIDGAFVDSHEMGKSYGTGMALLVLKNCTK